jgi:tetratricopeptide (TPR) repeat protein
MKVATDAKGFTKTKSRRRNKTMKLKPMLTIGCSALFVLAASGPDTRQTIAKFNESNAYALKGQQLLEANKPEEALKAFQQAAQLNPDNRQAMIGQ